MKENGVFDKLANIVVKRPKLIIIIWALILAASIGVVATQQSTLSYDMTQMEMRDNPDSVIGMEIIAEDFYQSNETTMGTIIVVQYANATDETNFFNALNTLVNDDTHFNGNAEVQRYDSGIPDGNDFLALYAMTYTDPIVGIDEVSHLRDLVNQAKTNAGLTGNFATYVTGSDAIGYDTEAGATEDISKIDPISILLILLLIGFFFRSVAAAATPPLVVGAAYGIMLCLMFFLGSVMDIFYITPIMMLVSMLGAGCDYSIFLMARYREERKGGKDKEAALKESVKWAGESITTSGLSVIIGFGVMSFCSFSMISSMGIVLAFGIVVALLAALTLIPAILALIGDKMFYPSKIETYQEGSKAMNGLYGKMSRAGQRYFKSAAKHAIKYAKPIVLAAILVTVPLAYVTLTEPTSYDMIATMPPGESKDGVDVILNNDSIGGGILMPTYVLVEYNESMATIDTFAETLTWITSAYDTNQTATAPMFNDIMNNVSNIDQVIDPFALPRIDPTIDYGIYYENGLISTDGKTIKLTVITESEPMSTEAMKTITDLRAVADQYMDPAMAMVLVTGSAAVNYDISEIVSGEFLWIEIGVIILIFALLFFVLKSYLTPLRAIATILMSIVWTVGLTHILFEWVLDVPVLWLIPIILLVVCLGLGMDYDILLTTRIRENVVKGMNNDEAISHALEKSGAVITICGLIMAGTFGTLMLSSAPMLQEFGFALGFAIFVDALIVRTYIVPAIMHLMGDWNWKGPKWMHRKNKVAETIETK